MENLEQQPKFCYTAAGVLIQNQKVLLVKHKKLKIWLNPGGHIEVGELPHQAAEREFWEETGIKVLAYSTDDNWGSKETGYEHLPNPFGTNLHWISEAAYQDRLAGKPISGKGCEKHLNFMYLVKPVGSLEFQQNVEETLGIAWFTLEEAQQLETHDNIRREIKKAFELVTHAK